MRAFDTAWDLLKMPFHGASLTIYEQILSDGKMNLSLINDSVWFASDPYEALFYAERATKRDREDGRESHPILLHIPSNHKMLRDVGVGAFSESPIPVGDVERVWSWKDYEENPFRPVSTEIDLLEDD